MATDIHGVVEIKQHTRWEGVIVIDGLLERNYAVFSALFGVRGDHRPITGHRGLPEDCSSLTALRRPDRKDSYPIHSSTWITHTEVQQALYPYGTQPQDIRILLELMQVLHNEYAGIVRLVVWFDN